MKLINAMVKEILSLFLDDEFLALAALVVVGATAILAKIFAVAALAAGGVLVVGCLGVLLLSVWRTAHALATGTRSTGVGSSELR
jgi:hypothetical protein